MLTIWSSMLRENSGRKNNLVAQIVCFKMPWTRDLQLRSRIQRKYLSENYFFLKTYVTSKGAVSHNALYYQQLSIARYQVNF